MSFQIVVLGEDGSLAGSSQQSWSGEIPTNCQLCNTIIVDTFIDGKIAPLGPWGIMCCACHAVHGAGLGEGKGQMYHKQNDECILVPAKNSRCIIKNTLV